MKYVCLIYQDEAALGKMPKEEVDKLNDEYYAFSSVAHKDGRLILGQGLSPSQTATTVRVRDGKLLITDGPFAETKEQLDGVWLIEANDLDDAIQIAAKIPSARVGSIEVRPIREHTRP